MPTFTSGADTYTITAAGNYDLDLLDGDDRLNVYGGTNVTAHLGLGNDLAIVKAALVNIFGDAGADRFDIYASSAVLDGGADNDTINVRGGSGLSAHGGLGDDRFNFYADTSSITLYGDDGNDDFFGYNHNVSGSLYGGAGNDYFVQFRTGAILLGGTGNDIYRITVGSPAAIVENAGEGSDSVQVARGYDYTLPDNVENLSTQGFSGSVLIGATVIGNALNNHIAAHNNGDTINGLDGNDSIGGKGGDDTIDGGNGNDFLDGGTGNDTLIGRAGNDTLQGRAGSDAMSGGLGDDTYYLDSDYDTITENVGEGTDTVRVSLSYALSANVENAIVQSGVGGAVLTGNDLDNVLSGNSGDDSLIGAGGNDTLKGGAGSDWMGGGAGDDTYTVDSVSDSVHENVDEGIDTVRTALDGYVLPANVEIGDVLNSAGQAMSGNEIRNLLNGGSGGDHLSGQEGDDILFGFAGNDFLDGGAGYDYAEGGLGDDTYYVSSFYESSGFNGIDDEIVENVGEGHDALILSSAATGWTATLADNIEDATVIGTGEGRFHGNALDNVLIANMTLPAGAIMYLYGGDGNDQLSIASTGAGRVSLSGDNGNDVLTGSDGNDGLSGGFGNDILDGGAGDDTLSPGGGSDTMTGGSGNDRFTIRQGESIAATPNTIMDFHSPGLSKGEQDTLDLHFIDANSNVTGDQAFTYIGTAAFSGSAGELRATSGKGGTSWHLYGDTNGDSVADFEIILHLVDTTVLDINDVVL